MHMADALISPAVAGVTTAISVAGLGYSIKRIDITKDEKKIPLMGVMGAFVFAAQMINFTIPATGSSGHIGGGLLLAAMLGPNAGFVTIASILFVQALFFGDGGLMALGCNIFNIGFMTCYVAYPLIFKPLLKNKYSKKNITIASMVSVIIGLQLGAFAVVLETLISGISELPFSSFLLLMQPIHLAIGIIEGIITAGVLFFVYEARPEFMLEVSEDKPFKAINKKSITIFLIIAVITGGVLSIFASSYPDGLEWSIMKTSGLEEIESNGFIHEFASGLQEKMALLPDYNFRGNESNVGTSVSGIIGIVIMIALIFGIGFVLKLTVSKRKNK